MKITIEIPDETILASVSVATQDTKRTISLGVFHICTDELVDGNTVDFKTLYDKRKEAKDASHDD